MSFNQFKGASNYIADPELMAAVNAAITLQRPLLVKGEPGTGKTMLAHAVTEALGTKMVSWHVKSTSKAIEARLQDAGSRDSDQRAS